MKHQFEIYLLTFNFYNTQNFGFGLFQGSKPFYFKFQTVVLVSNLFFAAAPISMMDIG
jgi:hypothetical protein